MSFNELLFYYSPETCKLGCVSHASHMNPPPSPPRKLAKYSKGKEA